MRSRHCARIGSGLAVLFLLAGVAPAAPAKPARPAADFLPDRVLAAAFMRNGDQQLQALRKKLAEQEFEKTPAGQALNNNAELAQGKLFLGGLAAVAGVDLWQGAGAFMGSELAVALVPQPGGKPGLVAAAVLRDADVVKKIAKQFHTMAGLEYDGKPDPARSTTVGDLVIYSPSEDLHYCITDEAWVLANSRDLIKAALEGAKSGQGTLSRSGAYKQALADVPANAVVWASGDVAALRGVLAGGKPMPMQVPNALAGLLFGAWWHTLANADKAVIWATAEKDTLALHARVTSRTALPETYRGFMPKVTDANAWSAEKLPGYLAEMSITRGWADLFAEREALLTTQAASDLVNFSSVLTTLMGKVDFVDDFLPNVAGPVRLIVARQDFNGKPYLPTPRLPAFALVVPLRAEEAAQLGRRLQTASQMAVSFLNYEAAQKNEPAYLIENQKHQNIDLLTTTFADAPADTQPAGAAKPAAGGVRYNFAPAAAVVKDRYILATSADLLKNLVDAVLAGGKPAGKADADTMIINGRELAAILKDNRNEMVTNNMLEKNHSRAQAEGEVDTLLGLAALADRLELVSTSSDKQANLTLRLVMRKAAAN